MVSYMSKEKIEMKTNGTYTFTSNAAWHWKEQFRREALAEKGIEMATPLDIIKDPYVYLMRADRIWRVKHNGKNDQSNRQGKTVCKI